ncbi:MAG: hypothetical protein AB2401_08800 [Bacillus sp. (in: firmicutes)]
MFNVGMMDQAETAMKDLARLLAAYSDELLKQGFERNEVIEMVINAQRNLMTGKGE